jgi:hypothetical protein
MRWGGFIVVLVVGLTGAHYFFMIFVFVSFKRLLWGHGIKKHWHSLHPPPERASDDRVILDDRTPAPLPENDVGCFFFCTGAVLLRLSRAVLRNLLPQSGLK